MTNVRRIHHYWEEKRKDVQRKMAAETGAKAAPEQPCNLFSLLLKAFLTGKRSFMPLSKAYLGC
jgi:hypothetical protein